MSDQEHESPPTAPGLPQQRMRLNSRRRLRERLDDMLRAFWGDLIAHRRRFWNGPCRSLRATGRPRRFLRKGYAALGVHACRERVLLNELPARLDEIAHQLVE
jgi:hypothetical protein